MVSLPNGCYCTELKVNPSNWKEPEAPMDQDWFIWYRFYDPAVLDDDGKIKPKLVPVKGMNHFKKISERRDFTKRLIKEELYQLEKEGYNPITGCHSTGTEINENMGFCQALDYAFDHISVEHLTKLDIKSVLKYCKDAAEKMRVATIPMKQIKRKHILLVLEQCKKDKAKWSDNLFNHYRKYLSLLFANLVEAEIVDTNPLRDLAKKKTLKRIRQTIDDQDRQPLDEYLLENYPTLRRFVHIYYHSGARIAELVCVRAFDVDLKRQRYKVTLKKGKQYREVWKIIKDIALPFWEDIMSQASPADYLFSEFLKPGVRRIPPKHLTKRWRMHVKEKLGIEADLSSLKHLNATDMRAFLSAQEVAELNSHTTTAMVVNIYDVKNDYRENDKIKRANNSFTGQPAVDALPLTGCVE
ncbi:MAG: hypothetical protein JWQ30_1038 [Sediminibacterium sp.]|nr:hypothetical protein [Sediminibacterium sp.]